MTDTITDLIYYATADDDHSGCRVGWDGQAYVVVGIETGYQVARTSNPAAAAAFVGAYLISYDGDAHGLVDGDEPTGAWTATAAQGRRILAELDDYAAELAEAAADQ